MMIPKRTLRSLLPAVILVAGAAATLAPGDAAASRGVTVKGSDTMVILCQRWAEAYMKTHRRAIVQVTGGGSGTGIAALINGTTDICMSSRAMKDAEKKKLRDRFQGRPVLPTAETVHNNSYPLSRELYFYVRTKPGGDEKAFIDWVLSPEGQALVTEVGYFPLSRP